jgi:general secretion pathway protein D
LIEAAIIEVLVDDADQLGVQWALGDLNSGVGLINFRMLALVYLLSLLVI